MDFFGRRRPARSPLEDDTISLLNNKFDEMLGTQRELLAREADMLDCQYEMLASHNQALAKLASMIQVVGSMCRTVADLNQTVVPMTHRLDQLASSMRAVQNCFIARFASPFKTATISRG
jgi:uncharacterized coiled-coil protein SlyX